MDRLCRDGSPCPPVFAMKPTLGLGNKAGHPQGECPYTFLMEKKVWATAHVTCGLQWNKHHQGVSPV
jgi:hypothetical protein